MNKEVRRAFLRFAVSPQATWLVNFLDLRGAAVTRMAPLTPGGRISDNEVKKEEDRLLARWQTDTVSKQDNFNRLLSQEQLKSLDLFDRMQLENVLAACNASDTLAQAGRQVTEIPG